MGQKAPRRIRFLERRNRVAEFVAKGWSERRIAEELGVGKTTVARDKKWLLNEENRLRMQEQVEEDRSLQVAPRPTSVVAYREDERSRVIQGIKEHKTYETLAAELGISLSTVMRHANSWIAEYGDFGGRTMQDWRNEQLMKTYAMMAELADDMEAEPIPDSESGWDLNPFQAGRIRDAARKRYFELMQYQAKLLQLLVNKTEVDVEQKVIVAAVRNVDFGAFPPQDQPIIVEG